MRVELETGSRLHFGLLCPAAEQRWYYGGIGLMVQDPGCQITLQTSSEAIDNITAEPELNERIQRFLTQYRLEHDSSFPFLEVTSHRPVPLHSGLGTGTQLTLALATGCRVLSGKGMSRDITGIARQFGRSRRSAIGTMGFVKGGFQIDYGRHEDRVERLTFPEEWRFVLIRPNQAAGLSGDSEESFFGSRPPLHAETLSKLAEQIEEHIVPSVEHADFDRFASGLQIYGDLAGADFAAEQGGLFSSEAVRNIVDRLRTERAVTAVQSSWGPTVCLPAESESDAQQLVTQLRNICDDQTVDFQITAARNEGATVRTEGDFVQRAFG